MGLLPMLPKRRSHRCLQCRNAACAGWRICPIQCKARAAPCGCRPCHDAHCAAPFRLQGCRDRRRPGQSGWSRCLDKTQLTHSKARPASAQEDFSAHEISLPMPLLPCKKSRQRVSASIFIHKSPCNPCFLSISAGKARHLPIRFFRAKAAMTLSMPKKVPDIPLPDS